MSPSSNPLVMLLDIFRAPSACFLALYQRGAWGWQPYIFLILSPFLFWGAYFDLADFEAMRQVLVSQLPNATPEQIAQIDANTLMASEIISDVFGRTLTIIMLAMWFNLATKNNQLQLGFWKWFAAASVMIFPAVLGDLASYVSVLLQHGDVMIYAADLNSLNGLIKLPLGHSWAQFSSAFPLLMPWYIVLGYAALGTWTQLERGPALVIATLPWVAFYAIWALYILLLG
ncbi:YIP1 family protein [Vibrio sp. WXL210]|uniref:YIP1 family protein n=1 Tax=Vibrio sp. WXL210 TaxID=3450709 RepID=UPI003EC5DCDD